MAITAAKLIVEVDANTGKAQQGLQHVEDKLRKLAGTGNSVGQIFTGVFGANLAAGAISSLRGLAAEGLTAYANYERLGMSLQTLTARELQNSGAATDMAQAYAMAEEPAQALLEWTQALAIQSPFTQDDVAQAFRMAQAYGFTAEEAKRLTQATIDFAAGTGASGSAMQTISLALGQIQAKGKLAGQEVLQLVNAGLSVDQILAKAFGKSTAEIVEMRERGLIPADQAIQAIVTSLEQDFGGAAERQADTFSGLISSLEDIKTVGLREFFTGTFEAIQPYVQEFVGAFTDGSMQEKIREIGEAFGEWVTDVAGKIKEIVDWWTNLDGSTQKLILAMGVLVAMRGPVFGLFADITGGASKAIGIFSSLAGGIGSITPLLGPMALALGVGVVAWKAYEAQMEKNEKTLNDTADAWTDFWATQESGDPMEIANEYAAAQQKIRDETKETNALFLVFSSNSRAQLGNWSILSREVLQSTDSYDAYRAALEEAIAGQNLMIDSNGNLMSIIGRNINGGPITQLVQENYLVGEAMFETSRYTSLLAESQQELAASMKADSIPYLGYLGTKAELAARAEAKLTAETEAAAEAQQNMADAIKSSTEAVLSAGLAGTLTQEMEEYQRTLEELGPAHDDLLAKLEYLNVEGWIPSAEAVEKYAQELMDKNDGLTESAAMEQAEITLLASHQSQLTEVKEALGENEAAQLAAAEAMRQATAEMIYQQAAAGLDAQASLELARAMGMINEQDYVVASSIQALKLQYDAMDGSIDGVITNTAGFIGATVQVQQAADDLIAANIPITFDNIALAMQNLGNTDVDLAGMVDPMMQELGRLDPESEEFATLRANIDALRRGAATGTTSEVEAATTDITTLFADVTTTATTTLTEVNTAFTEADWSGMGKTAGGELTEGFKTSLTSGDKSGVGLYGVTTAAVLEVKRLWTTDPNASWFGVGLALVNGIAEGVRAGKGSLAAAMKEIIAAALAAAEAAANVGSPSKLFADEIGVPISEGIAMGILEAGAMPAKAAETVIHTTSETVYNQPITLQPVVSKEIDMYEMALVLAGMIKG